MCSADLVDKRQGTAAGVPAQRQGTQNIIAGPRHSHCTPYQFVLCMWPCLAIFGTLERPQNDTRVEMRVGGWRLGVLDEDEDEGPLPEFPALRKWFLPEENGITAIKLRMGLSDDEIWVLYGASLPVLLTRSTAFAGRCYYWTRTGGRRMS